MISEPAEAAEPKCELRCRLVTTFSLICLLPPGGARAELFSPEKLGAVTHPFDVSFLELKHDNSAQY
eukprot:19263-Heterococcus_DN1.PRE.2